MGEAVGPRTAVPRSAGSRPLAAWKGAGSCRSTGTAALRALLSSPSSGGFLLTAAVRYDAREALGLGGSLRALQQSGRVLLAVTAAGLLALGAINLSRRLTGASVRPQGASSNGTRGFRPRRAPTDSLSV